MSDSVSDGVTHASRWVALIALALAGALLLFVDKPFHVDDPFFVWQAKHIAAHPADPFGFSAVWFPFRTPGWMLAQNPPGFSYLLALVGSVVGFAPRALHVALVVPALFAVVGTHALARAAGCSARGALAAAGVAASSPLLFVSATTVMTDVTMTALWVWSAVFWLRALDAQRSRRALLYGASAVLLAAAVVVKYAALLALPVLAIAWIAWIASSGRMPSLRSKSDRSGDRVGVAPLLAPMLALCVPVVVLVAYELCMRSLYGASFLLDAATYATQNRPTHGVAWRSLSTLALLGAGGSGAAVVMLVAAPRPLRRRALVVLAAGVAVLTAAIFALGTWWWAPRESDVGYALTSALMIASAGVCATACAAHLWRAPRDAARGAWLIAWIAGVVAWAALLNWTPNARAVLPAIPALCVVAGLVVTKHGVHALGALVPIALSLLFSLFAARADASLAVAQCDAGRSLVEVEREASARVWFLGHWGFQHCAEEAGALAFDAGSTEFRVGDVLAVPENNAFVKQPPADAFTEIAVIDIDVMPWLATMDPRAGAGFYGASMGGPVPFSVDAGDDVPRVDRTRLYRATRAFRWGAAPPMPTSRR